MELRHLRYFVAVADELNFTRAAEKLRLAQPSLTRQIQNLEAELGVVLLDRAKNQVTLTEEGQGFLVDARRLVDESLESIKSVQRFKHSKSGQLNLGYSFKFNFEPLPATLATCSLTCPEISVNLFDLSPAEQMQALGSRKIDLGFIGLRPQAPTELMADLAWECVAQHEIVVVLPADHPLAAKKKVSVTDLKSLFFVTMSEATHPGTRAWLSALCQEAGFTPRILQDVGLESGIMTFVAEGLGVTLARAQIQRLPHRGVVFRPLAVAHKVDYWIAWHQNNKAKALAKYIDIIRKEAPTWD